MARKSTAAKQYKIARPEYTRYIHGLRSSSAAERHTPKTRKGTRKARKDRDIEFYS